MAEIGLQILTKLTKFSTTQVTYVHEASFACSIEDAWEPCKSYKDWITVLFMNQDTDPQCQWVTGSKPGQIGGQVNYRTMVGGIMYHMTEQVVQLEKTKTGYIMGYRTTAMDPESLLRHNNCTWELIRQPGNKTTKVIWTRNFDNPKVLGVVSLSGVLMDSFAAAAIGNMRSFKRYFEHQLPKLHDKVVIVGAGPSGLHMAHLLKKRGVHDITIKEVTDRYGGKTVSVPDTLQRGVWHELGTCYLHPAYYAVRYLVKELQQQSDELKELSTMKDEPHLRYDITNEIEPIAYDIHYDGEQLSMEDWTVAEVQNDQGGNHNWMVRFLSKFFKHQHEEEYECRLAKVDVTTELLIAKNKYCQLHRDLLGTYDYTMPPQPLHYIMDNDLTLPFDKFLEKHQLTALKPFFGYANTCQGYGTLANTPTFWCMCWITPDLLDGYFTVPAFAKYGKKMMFVHGWLALWDRIVFLHKLKIDYNTHIHTIKRPTDTNGKQKVVIKGTQHDADTEFVEEYDFLIMAAPIKENIDHLGYNPTFEMDLTAEERKYLCSNNMVYSQFQTNLYRTLQPQPDLRTHLTLYRDRVLEPKEAGLGKVFAFRDSYLAVNPNRTVVPEEKSIKYFLNKVLNSADKDNHINDPARDEVREQMCYQFVDVDKKLSEEQLEKYFKQWADSTMGQNGYQVLRSPLCEAHPFPPFNYFYHYNARGLKQDLPWKVLELQGKKRTLFVHAQTFFESVLDIVNYNNMIMDGFSGKLESLLPPQSDKKPKYYETMKWKVRYGMLKPFFRMINFVLNPICTFFYFFFWPFWEYVVFRIQRYVIQKGFHTQNLGGIESIPFFSMQKFLDVTPSMQAKDKGIPDTIIEYSKPVLDKYYPYVPKVDNAMKWSVSDYRLGVRWFIRNVKPTYLWFIPSWTKPAIQWLTFNFPVVYNYLFSWICFFNFGMLTGYGYKVEDEQGGGFYFPKCHMLIQARKAYGIEKGNHVCATVCKEFTQEFMLTKGLVMDLQPNYENASCMVRGVSCNSCSMPDHTIHDW